MAVPSRHFARLGEGCQHRRPVPYIYESSDMACDSSAFMFRRNPIAASMAGSSIDLNVPAIPCVPHDRVQYRGFRKCYSSSGVSDRDRLQVRSSAEIHSSPRVHAGEDSGSCAYVHHQCSSGSFTRSPAPDLYGICGSSRIPLADSSDYGYGHGEVRERSASRSSRCSTFSSSESQDAPAPAE